MAARPSTTPRAQRATASVLLCALVCSPGALVHAEAPEAPLNTAASRSYEALIEEAIQEYRIRHFPEARSLFARANQQFENARALRGLGMVEFEMRNYVESVRQLRRALEHRVKPLDGPLRRETEALLARAQSFIAELEISASPMPSSVTVDGARVELGSEGVLMLEVGDHVVEFQALGHAPERRRFSVRGGERRTVDVVFASYESELPVAGLGLLGAPESALPKQSKAAIASTPDRQTKERQLYKNPWLWTSVGIAAAALGAGLGFGLTNRETATQQPVARDPIASVVGP